MKSRAINLLAVLAVLLVIMAAADTANAQRRRESRGRGMTKAQVNAVINRVEDRVDNFVSNYDKSLDRSRLDGSSREDWLMKRARDLESATGAMHGPRTTKRSAGASISRATSTGI